MTGPAVEFDHVKKHYRGARVYTSLREDLSHAAAALLKRRPRRSVVRALDDVSFTLDEGSATAIVGLNGAGKSTALKLISRITYPTDGVVRVRGRVGALIEVAAGLHPELTGRENVDLYGRILGFTRADLRRRFNEIEEFASVGDAIDQPVKQFSTGMNLRLGFAIASHLEPSVLLVDEALSVGDAGFQHRCYERMSKLLTEGRTLILVTHDMRAVEALCERAILLDSGVIADDGPAPEVVNRYLASAESAMTTATDTSVAGEKLRVLEVSLRDLEGRAIESLESDAPAIVRIRYHAETPIREPMFMVQVVDRRAGGLIAATTSNGERPSEIVGDGYADCVFEHLPLQPRTYELALTVRGATGGMLVAHPGIALLRVTGHNLNEPAGINAAFRGAPLRVPYHWKFSRSV